MPDATSATALLLSYSRCNAPARIPEWNQWMYDTHVPAMAATPGVRAATHWALSVQPTPGMPSVGFSHVTIYELTGDPDDGDSANSAYETANALLDAERSARERGELDPNHAVVETDLLAAHGRWNAKPLPTDELTGHILAFVLCNDPKREDEWNDWNDDVHMPDMLASDGFAGVSRWRRVQDDGRRARHATLYDVGPIGVEEAVARSAAVMPGIAAAGRKHECHVGALTITLVRA